MKSLIMQTAAALSLGGFSILQQAGRNFMLDPDASTGTTGEDTETQTTESPDVGAVVEQAVATATAPLLEQIADLRSEVEELQNQPPPKKKKAPWSFIQGELPSSAEKRGYQVYRAMAYKMKSPNLSKEQCKIERDLSDRLREMYVDSGQMDLAGTDSLLVPFGSAEIWDQDSGLGQEVRELLTQGAGGASQDQLRWSMTRAQRLGWAVNVEQALSAYDDSLLGVFTGPTTQGEMINLVRAREVFSRLGATQLTLPPNGKLVLPRQTSGMTAYWVGENEQISSSEPGTGTLTMMAKKLAALGKIPNELVRFGTTAVEAWMRMEMATVMALKASQSMLDGVGSTNSIQGLINTTGINSHTASTVATDGNTFEPEDIHLMLSAVEEQDHDIDLDGFHWVMRPKMFHNLLNRRTAPHTAGTYDGGWLFPVNRDGINNAAPAMIAGHPVTRSTQVSATREKGSSSDLSYVLGGVFRHYLIGRVGVLEFATSTQGDTAFQNDQTWVRAIQHLDAVARYADAFVYCDSIDMDLPA